jgi:hypothetical protein
MKCYLTISLCSFNFSLITFNSSSGESYIELTEFAGFEVIKDQMMVMMPGQILDFAIN